MALFLLIAPPPFGRSMARADSPSLSPPSGIPLDPSAQFDFSEHLFKEGDYENALLEYKRFVHFFPNDGRAGSALFQTGVSYFKIGKFSDSIQTFETVIARFSDTPLFEKSHFMISQCHRRLGEPSLAVNTLHNLIVVTKDTDVKDKAHFESGWLYLEMPWKAESIEKARQSFSQVSEENQQKYKVEALITRLDRVQTGIDKIPSKNPVLAGSLSIIPGLGQIYCGRYQDALISFVLNGGLILAAKEAFDDRNNALGGVISFVGLGFYAGNIYGASTSAHKYNETKRREFIDRLRQDVKIGVSGMTNQQGVMLSFHCPFD